MTRRVYDPFLETFFELAYEMGKAHLSPGSMNGWQDMHQTCYDYAADFEEWWEKNRDDNFEVEKKSYRELTEDWTKRSIKELLDNDQMRVFP